MILFHGTTEEHIKNIKKKGLFAATKDQWLLETTDNQSICCLCQRPVSGEGGNPLFFARDKQQNGYIIIVKIHFKTLLEEKLIAIYDNKILDDYTQKHFFVRQEFREKGYDLFCALDTYYKKNKNFKKLDVMIRKRSAKKNDEIIHNPEDQRSYYKEFRNPETRYILEILDIEVSDEFHDFMNHIGPWKTLLEFLQLHFQKIDPQKWQQFCEKNNSQNHQQFWNQFYQSYPVETKNPRYQNWQNWFSTKWLTSRKIQEFKREIHRNCQVLVRNIEAEHILEIMQITTPSGLLPEFRLKAKSGTTQAVWRHVDAILGRSAR